LFQYCRKFSSLLLLKLSAALEERKDELREYCRLDTLAMVRIFEVQDKAAM
jgi:hypothetical protein